MNRHHGHHHHHHHRGGGGAGGGGDSRDNFAAAEDSTVYFTGAPQSATENQLRSLFEQLGHVRGLRLMPNRNRPVTDGFVDFTDPADAKNAVERLNGHLFSHASAATPAEASSVVGGEYKMQVQLATNRKRARGADRSGGGRADDPSSAAAAAAAACFVDSDDEGGGGGGPSGPPLCFPKHFKDPISTALAANVSMTDAFEAVEQLRVISLERPDETRELLEQHPVLKVAVIQILQLAGRLPMPLPSEAFNQRTTTNIKTLIRKDEAKVRQGLSSGLAVGGGAGISSSTAASTTTATSATSATANATSSSSSSVAAQPQQPSVAAGGGNAVQYTTEQLFEKVSTLTDAQIAKIKGAKLEDFDKIKEPQRSLFRQLNMLLNSD